MYEKLKSFLLDDAIFHTLLILLVGVVSFGLGRQSMVALTENNTAMAGVTVIDAPQREEVVVAPNQTVVVSKSGTKYHLLNCPGASQIKEENKLFFGSPALAEAAGYSPAANCPGL